MQIHHLASLGRAGRGRRSQTGLAGSVHAATLAARHGLAARCLVLVALAVALATAAPAALADVKVAMLPGWGTVAVTSELNAYWSAYGTTPLKIDTSLLGASSFTYADLAATNANVLWISNPSGYSVAYTPAEVQAIQRYTSEGHSLLGTFLAFQWSSTDNRGLAPLFGLSATTSYNTTEVSANQSFNILASSSPVFARLANPYLSGGYGEAQVPAAASAWSAKDLSAVTLLAETPDNRGIITWYGTGSSHAIYVSEMVEYNGNAADTQFLYNALTATPEPATLTLLALGGLAAAARRRRTARS
jgi:PEP-CTERM motif